MRTKRLIATALAAAMIFGLVSMGFASDAPLSDVVGHEFEDEIRALAGLKVIEGYTDGTFKPEGTLTRAEYTALIARILGLESMAKAMKGETVPFSDVDGSHWASGYILLAEALGVVNGYPDGTFKPENTVSYAEAIKMTLTAMGYKEEGFPVLRWPVTWLLQANEIGLDDDVTVLADFPILRADVAKVLHNSLDKHHVKIEKDEFVERGDAPEDKVTFFSKLGVSRYEGQVVDSPERWDNEKGKIQVVRKKDDSKDFEFDAYEGLLGHKVEVWYEDDTVYAIKTESTEKALTWKQYNEDVKKKDKDADKELLAFVNYVKVDLTDKDNKITSEHEDIVVVYNEDGDPIAVKALHYSIGTVTDTYVYKDTRKDIYFEGDVETLRLADAEVEYVGVDGFDDIEEDDVVHFIKYEEKDDDDVYIVKRALVVVARDIYKGTVTEVISGDEWKVDGKVFKVKGASFESNDLKKDPLGAKVTLYMNKDGKVVRITGETRDKVAKLFGVVQKTVAKWESGKTKHIATIITKDGEVEFEYKKNDKITVGKAVYELSDKELAVVEAVYDGKEVELTHVKVKDDEIRLDADEISAIDVDTKNALWLEGKKGSYNTRPRPYIGDKVELYKFVDSENVVYVVGIVK